MYGMLTDYATGTEIRPATADELRQSLAAGETGAFELDGQAVFVAGGDEDAVSDDQPITPRPDDVTREVRDIAASLQRYEDAHPGTILAVATMTPEARSEFLWSLRRGNAATHPDLMNEDHEFTAPGVEWRIRDAWYEHAYATVVPTTGAPAVALTTSGHCPVGSECESCQWEAETPAERAEADRRSAEQSARIARLGRGGSTPQPVGQPEQLADWERDLLNQP